MSENASVRRWHLNCGKKNASQPREGKVFGGENGKYKGGKWE